jgi:hypothetical protein
MTEPRAQIGDGLLVALITLVTGPRSEGPAVHGGNGP